ncbi:uncharacterized protein LOC114296632 isoform X2 [Camellia sinensis]|uniref:uncharacterized protein LOC114296632 isoform X2 n=1 Tax=Camellia sinensis TaxID=4442 RepID=UPI0010359269|nr:uncharacterized protein LOC114296632 isoform X2 [Camellia sinensis]
MVAGSRIEGGTQILSARVLKIIQSIKQIVHNHSDAEIYAALKEYNMDPNETAQKLLNQDPFHEVRRKRDKKKENVGYKGLMEPRKPSEFAGQGMKFSTSDRGVRRGGYGRNVTSVAGGSREFRVVKDNRINQNTNREMKPLLVQYSTSASEQVNPHVSEKGSTGTSHNQKSSGARYSSRGSAMPTVSHHRQSRDSNSSSTTGNELQEERRAPVPPVVTQEHGSQPNDSQPHSTTLASNHSVVGVYSSSSDPVHVPSPDSRSAATIGAIKREFGVVGVRRQPYENSVTPSSAQSSSFSNLHLGKDGSSSGESFRPFVATSKSDQPGQTNLTDSVVPSMSVSRSFLSNQYNNRPHQQIVGHQKVLQPNKEWKPKLSKKSSHNGPGVIGTPAKSVPHPTENPKDLETDAAQVQDKPSQVNNYENQNVIIAEHIRVAESDRCRLTFGSFGAEFDSSRDFVSESHTVGSAENSSVELCTSSLSASAPEFSSDDISASKHVDLLDDQVRNSGSNSPASGAISDNQMSDKKVSSSPPNLDSYSDIGLVRDDSPSYTPSESQHQQDAPELPNFSAYDPQTGYDIPYFRPSMDETVRGHGLPSPQEALSSHTANSVPTSAIAMVQQQQQPVAQMYPQLHVSHFANLMPYRQFLSPVYVPPMPMPGYSSNATYPHPSNGSSYLLMPGGSSHLGANSLKYGIQQFKPVPGGSPTGFGNFTSSTGYAMNAQGVVGGATGLDDSSRLKYKDGSLYVPNPQAETSEIWIQNPRELPGLQSASYYNMPGQTPHAAYLPSHTGHAASFNAAAAAQSSHMQFPGLYHPPPQPTAIASPHHLGPAMGGNVGVGVAAATPGTQVGAYQQPQLGHLNWTTNF